MVDPCSKTPAEGISGFNTDDVSSSNTCINVTVRLVAGSVAGVFRSYLYFAWDTRDQALAFGVGCLKAPQKGFWGLGFRFQGAGFRVLGSGFRVQTVGLRV